MFLGLRRFETEIGPRFGGDFFFDVAPIVCQAMMQYYLQQRVLIYIIREQ